MTPNRVVAVASAVIALALAVLPVIGNMDWTSTAGVVAGIVAVLGVTLKWLDGWQKFEQGVGYNPASLRSPRRDAAALKMPLKSAKVNPENQQKR